MIERKWVKETAARLGAALCGIASADSFTEAPKGFHPVDVLPNCRSVIVLGCPFNPATLKAASTSPYTITRNDLSNTMNHIASRFAEAISLRGCAAVPIGSIGPDEYDAETGKYHGTISLKHAAVLAGLGKMGKNTLLINDKYGNMVWLSAVLTEAELTPDPLASYEACLPACKLCLDNCPVKALDGVSINQPACHEHAFGAKNGSDWKIHCFTCRKICPHRLGIKPQQTI